jgi:hypothetical protein
MLTPRQYWSFVGSSFILPSLLIGLPLVSALLAVAAYKGVMWGQRREDEAAFRDAARSEVDSRDG